MEEKKGLIAKARDLIKRAEIFVLSGRTPREIVTDGLLNAPSALQTRLFGIIGIAAACIVLMVVVLIFSGFTATVWIFIIFPILAIALAVYSIWQVGTNRYTLISGECTGMDFGLQTRVWRGKRITALYLRDKKGEEYKISCRNEKMSNTERGDTVDVYIMGTPNLYKKGSINTVTAYAAIEVVSKAE